MDNYCEKWRLNINIKKTKVMILSKTERKAKTESNANLCCPWHLYSVVNQLEILRGLLNILRIIDD
jgi:hypothetical protein